MPRSNCLIHFEYDRYTDAKMQQFIKQVLIVLGFCGIAVECQSLSTITHTSIHIQSDIQQEAVRQGSSPKRANVRRIVNSTSEAHNDALSK